MLRRLFALIVLLALLGAGFYYWRLAPGGPRHLDELGRRLEDVRLATAVRAALALNRRLQGGELTVDAEQGRVTLRGTLPDESARRLALEVAAGVPGVRQVADQVRSAPPGPAAPGDDRTLGERLDDQALEAKIRLAFVLQRDLAGEPIEVLVRRRQVRLSGELRSAARRAKAVQVAGDVPDVVGVTDKLRRARPRGLDSRPAQAAFSSPAA